MKSIFKSSVAIAVASVLFVSTGVVGKANAADPVVEKAQTALAAYTVIIAISKLCNFDVEQSTVEVVVSNINQLMPKAKYSDKDMEDTINGSVTELGKNKAKFCGPGIEAFKQNIPAFEKQAVAAAEGTGVALKPIPTAAAPASPAADKSSDDAVKMMTMAIMIEAVSDECDIKLKDGQSLEIDRVQYFWRGRGNVSAADFAKAQTYWEAETKKNHDKYCAKSFGFQSTFDTLLKTIK